MALATATVPTAVAVLLYFPLWRSVGAEAVVSGFAVLLLALAGVPLFRYFKRRAKSPSAQTMWLIIFLFFLALSRIAEQMTVISFVGFLGNAFASVLFKLAERGEVKNED